MNRIIYLLTVVTIGLFLSGCNIFQQNNKEVIKLQIIEEDIITNNTRVNEEIAVNKGDLITLKNKQFYLCNKDANDIKIVNIKKDYIVISREKLSYDKNNANKTYTKETEENIKYNEKISPSINEENPLAGVCSQAKYFYYLKFIKK